MIGLGISVLVGFYLPLWLLFGFSLFFSIEKWLYYPTRKYKYLGKLYRLILNLSILSLLGFLVWSGIKLFSSQFTQSALIGSLLFVAELIFFIWMWRVVARNSWRWPSMKLTIISLIALAIIFAFAGVQPIASYKDNLVNKWDVYWEEQRIKNEEKQAQEELEEQERLEEQELEEERITEENSETNGDSYVNGSIDLVDNSLDTSIDDYAIKFNQYRQSKGLASLEFTDDLNRVAELRLKELYTDFSHQSAGNYNKHLAENIVMHTGFFSNSDALSIWQKSPGHNANMLDRNYRYTGYAIGNGYAVQLFTEYPTINGEPQLPPGWYWLD